jgi:transcriptional regulator with XRE-family HTH domain
MANATAERKPVAKPPQARASRNSKEHKQKLADGQKNYHATKDKMIGKKIHQLFAYLMIDVGVGWKVMVEGSGFSQGTVYKYKNGTEDAVPHHSNLKKINKWLNVPTHTWEQFLSNPDFTPGELLDYSDIKGKTNKNAAEYQHRLALTSVSDKKQDFNSAFVTRFNSNPDLWLEYYNKKPAIELVNDIECLTDLLRHKLSNGLECVSLSKNEVKPRTVELNEKERTRLKELLKFSMLYQHIEADELTELLNSDIVQTILDDDEDYQYPESDLIELVPHLHYVTGWIDNLPIVHPVDKIANIEELKDLLNR